MPLFNTAPLYLGESPVYAAYDSAGQLIGGVRAAVLAAFPPPDSLPNTVVLRKLRTDYPEFAIYAPLTADGIQWARWWFTNRFNVTPAGAFRMIRCTLSKLYASTPQAPQAENLTTQTQSIAPTSTLLTSGASARSGTWTASATVTGVTDIRYSTAVGDYVEYQVTTAGRLQFRTLQNSSNGGILDITVKDGAGTLITDSRLLQPAAAGVMTVNLKNDWNGCCHLPLAESLTADTYTVRVTVAASNPAGGRAYDGGFEIYATFPVTSAGQVATWQTRTLGVSVPTALLPGAVRVYTFTGTRVSWRYGQSTNAGMLDVRVFDATGTEIAPQYYQTVSRTLDAYYGQSVQSSVVVAAGLPYGAYSLRVQNLPTKNVLGTGYRAYDFGPIAYNEAVPGVIGVDEFDDMGANDAALNSGQILIGTGNLELAIKVRRLDEPAGSATDVFVGGIHGSETTPVSPVFTVDEATVDFAAGAVGAQWVGAQAAVTSSTSLKLPIDSSVFAAASYSFTVSRGGYVTDIGRTYSASVIVSEDYGMMLNVPSRQEGTPGYSGGFENVFAFPDSLGAYHNYPLHTDHSNLLPKTLGTGIYFNSGAQVSAEQTNWPEIDAAFSAPVFQSSRNKSFVQERSDKTIKFYNRCFPGASTGVTVPSGTAAHTKALYRIAIKP